MLDEQSGTSEQLPQIIRRGARTAEQKYGGFTNQEGTEYVVPGDSGGASRFFYCAKASRAEREAGLREAGLREAGRSTHGDGIGRQPKQNIPSRNHHPTVKPLALMRWLCRLVTPPGGIVLDPFAGSGTTGCAAVQEGLGFIGIEKQAEYVTIARARVDHWYRTTEPTLPLMVASP